MTQDDKLINEFNGDLAYLSNFYTHEAYPSMVTVEHQFQAAKSMLREESMAIMRAVTPAQAKQMGRVAALRPDWEQVKDQMMAYYVAQKFTQNPELGRRLLATGQAKLVEGNTWGDREWGVDLASGEGQNKLGLILMGVRATLRATQI